MRIAGDVERMERLLQPPASLSLAGFSGSELRHLIGTVFVLLMLPVAFTHIFQHLKNFRSPSEQRALVRIIAMVPLFGLVSLVSLSFNHLALYIQMLRESYEAFSIYCFLKYLISYLGDDQILSAKLAIKPARIGVHKPPFCCLAPWTMGEDFLLNCKLGALQYVVVRSTVSLATCVLYSFGLFEEGFFHPRSAYFWFTCANCISQTWALYTLVLFYHAAYKDLVHIDPFSKFLCIKGVVFFSWWQGLIIHVMVHQGWIDDTAFKRKEHIAKGIQDTLVCVEMLVASLAFYACFPATDYTSLAYKNPKRATSYANFADDSEECMVPDKTGAPAETAQKPHLRMSHSPHPEARQKARSYKEAQDVPSEKRMPVWRALVFVLFPLDVRADIASVISRKLKGRKCFSAATNTVALAVKKGMSSRVLS